MSEQEKATRFTELFYQHQRSLHAYILSRVVNTADAYDILQDTNLILWEKFDQFEKDTNFVGWACEIARYRILRFWRIQGRRIAQTELVTLEQLAERVRDLSDSVEREQALNGCIEKLRPVDQELIRRRYAPDGSVRQIADQLARSENSISQSLRRIRNRLQECVELSLKQLDEGVS